MVRNMIKDETRTNSKAAKVTNVNQGGLSTAHEPHRVHLHISTGPWWLFEVIQQIAFDFAYERLTYLQLL